MGESPTSAQLLDLLILNQISRWEIVIWLGTPRGIIETWRTLEPRQILRALAPLAYVVPRANEQREVVTLPSTGLGASLSVFNWEPSFYHWSTLGRYNVELKFLSVLCLQIFMAANFVKILEFSRLSSLSAAFHSLKGLHLCFYRLLNDVFPINSFANAFLGWWQNQKIREYFICNISMNLWKYIKNYLNLRHHVTMKTSGRSNFKCNLFPSCIRFYSYFM